MDNQNDDMIPEWQAKKEEKPAAPIQPAETGYGMSPLQEVPEAPQGPRPNSGPGIASFIMGLIGVLLSIGSYALIFSVILNNRDTFTDAKTAEALFDSNSDLMVTIGMGGLGILAAGVIMFVGFILGIVGLVQKNRKKGFAITGTILNGIFVAIAVLIVILGLVRYASGNV